MIQKDKVKFSNIELLPRRIFIQENIKQYNTEGIYFMYFTKYNYETMVNDNKLF